ncbi:hypothetical protein [Geomonas propionica]|uniref:Glycosyltransferase family 2 protein n=1 Tax=Geomonas propionica TaxID=2798582 RepID=A0ABS0YVF4_9BACT|nr:hypothetical protein [Geomonas propionica]MBJ6801940.1 hypothetical protein [Geomonas propionica]
MAMHPSQLAILVISCDNYADLWRPFYTLFRRFWPGCPYRVYHVSNYLEPGEEGGVPLAIGADSSWSDNVIKALAQVEEEYVLMMIDDLFLTSAPRLDELERVLDWVATERPNYLRLNPVPPPDRPCTGEVGVVSPGTLYRTGTVLALWRKEVLLDLLQPGENAWEFELHGTVRSDRWGGFYSTHRLLLPFVNGVIKGKWRRSALRTLASLGVEPDLERRKVMTFRETLLLNSQLLRSRALRCLPAGCRRQVKDLLSRGKCNYSLLK